MREEYFRAIRLLLKDFEISRVCHRSPALSSAGDFVFLAHDALIVLLLLLQWLQRKPTFLVRSRSLVQQVDLAEGPRSYLQLLIFAARLLLHSHLNVGRRGLHMLRACAIIFTTVLDSSSGRTWTTTLPMCLPWAIKRNASSISSRSKTVVLSGRTAPEIIYTFQS